MHQKMISLFLLTVLFILNACGNGATKAIHTSTIESEAKSTISITNSAIVNSTSDSSLEEQASTQENNGTEISYKTIDILVLVDKNDENSYNGVSDTKIDHFIAVTNKIYANSSLNIKLNIKKIQPYTLSNKSSDEVLYDVYDDKNISSLRNDIKADLVVAYRKYDNDGSCGVAFINKKLDEDFGYAHVSLECPSTTTAHEIGHTMGLTHSEHKSEDKGIFNYARGYGIEGEFVTIMAYQSTYHAKERVFNYSNPNIDCKGYECGQDEELNSAANAVKALRYTIDYVTSFK